MSTTILNIQKNGFDVKMVKCETCLNFTGINCLEPNGVRYGNTIVNSLEEIECPCYLDKAIGGLFGLGGFF